MAKSIVESLGLLLEENLSAAGLEAGRDNARVGAVGFASEKTI